VVRTRSKGAILEERSLIKWGEVICHGMSQYEDQKRQQGKLAIDLSSIVDFDPDYFED
jgi:hypothetical protein